MDLKDYVEQLYRTEQSTDVNRWELNDLRVWPLFRLQVISMFRNPEAYALEKGRIREEKPSPLTKIRSRFISSQWLKDHKKQLQAKLPSKPVDVMLYSKLAGHIDSVNGEWYDRIVDPFFELLEGKRVLKLAVNFNAGKDKTTYAHTPVIINEEAYRNYYYHAHLGDPKNRIADSGLADEICAASGLVFKARHVDSVLNEIMYYRDLFRGIFMRLRPKVVFMKCYYETDSAGLVLAAKDFGIKTVDVQHGKQGIAHPMYSHWSAIPAGGYELLPDFFWNWGEESLANINRFRNRKDVHIPVVGGNLWMAQWKDENFYHPAPETLEFVRTLERKKKVILVTLQPLDNAAVIPGHLAEAIRNSPEDWLWLLRKHPYQRLSPEELVKLSGAPASKIEIDQATALPLYFLLRKVHHHVTLWSSTAFEANDFGVPTTIVHTTGLSLYAEQIGNKVFHAALSAKEILDSIERGGENVNGAYIDTARATALNAIQSILEKEVIV